MLILGLNTICKWCSITTGGRTYTCPTKNIDGRLFFRFKNQWHCVSDYISPYTMELVEINNRVIDRPYKA